MATPDFVNLQFPSTLTVQAGMLTDLIFGQIWEAGLTESAGADPTIVAQLGYGPLGSDPETDTGWTWIDATFNVQAGNNDEYVASFTAPVRGGQYAYTYRFAIDDGVNPLTFTYGDLDGNGENAGLSFDPSQLGTLTVLPSPTIDFSDNPGGLKFDFDGSGDPVNDSAATGLFLTFDGADGEVQVFGPTSPLFFPSILAATGTAETDVELVIGTTAGDSFRVTGAHSPMTLEGRADQDSFEMNGVSGVTILGGDQRDTVSLTGANQTRYDGGSGNSSFLVGDDLTFESTSDNIFTIGGAADSDGFWSGTNISASGNSSLSLRNVEQFTFRGGDNTITITGDYTTGLDGQLKINAGGGVNTITVESSVGVFINDVVNSTSNSDTILLTGGDSGVMAFGGNDVIDTGERSEAFPDYDTISYAIDVGATENLRGLTADLQVRDAQGYATITITQFDGSIQTDLAKNFENLWGTVGNDRITADDTVVNDRGLEAAGFAGADILIGGAGTNRFDGGSGDDTLDGGAGDDRLLGGDVMFASNYDSSDNDILIGGQGNDIIYGDNGVVVPTPFAGNIDTAVFSGSWADYDIVTATDGSGIDGFQITHARNTGTTNDGEDSVFQVEQFQFADRTVSAANLLSGGGDTTPPTITSSGTAPTIAENSGGSQVVYTVTATDSTATGGPSNPLSYSLGTGGDENAFTIDNSSGAVTLTGNPDYEAKSSYSFTVVATDAAGNASQQPVTLGIRNMDEVAPTITSGATATAIAENSGAWQVVYTVTSTDTDVVSGATTYSLGYGPGIGGDESAFTIDNNSGAVTLTRNQDYEAKNSYSFTVVASDAAGNATQQTVTLAITNRDEVAPTITSGATATAIAENSGAGQVVYTVISTDTEVVSGTTFYLLGSGGSNESAFTIDSSSGAVTLTRNPDYEAKNNYSFEVVASDAAGNASRQTVTLGITNMDEVAPTITSGATATAIAENSGAEQVVYTVTSTDTDVVSGTTTYSLGAGGDESAFTINSNSGAVTLTGNPDYEAKSSYGFTVVATDAAGNADSQLVSLAITDLNEGTPTTTATITNVRETTANSPTSTSLTLSGTLSAALVAGEVVKVFDGAMYLGNATVVTTVSGTTWSYSNGETTAGNHTFNVEVANATGHSETSSASVIAGTTRNSIGAEALTGTGAGEYIFGFAGIDTINGFVGSDTVDGGSNGTWVDTIVLTTTSTDLNNATDAQIRNIELVSASGSATSVTIDLHNQSEGFWIFGSNNADTLTGGSGVDAIAGYDGADILIGGAGADILNGGAGGDSFIGGDGADLIFTEGLNDNVQDRVQFFKSSEFGDLVGDFDSTGSPGVVDVVDFGGSLKIALDDMNGANGNFAWVRGNGSNGGNTAANLNTTVEALYLAGTNGEGVLNSDLTKANVVANEFNAEFNITASSGQDALLVVNATNSDKFAVYSYLESGTGAEIQAAELTLIGDFFSNGDVGTNQFNFI